MKAQDHRDTVGLITVPLTYFYADPGSLFSPALKDWYRVHVKTPYKAVCFPKVIICLYPITLRSLHMKYQPSLICADPGSTATDLNNGYGKQTVTEGTDAIVQLATIGKDGPTGTFINRDGMMLWYRNF